MLITAGERRIHYDLAGPAAGPVVCMAHSLSSDSGVWSEQVPALLALNHDLRNEYVKDCHSGLKRWNRVLEKAGVDRTLTLPHVGFNRHVGLFADHHITPAGELVGADAWEAKKDRALPAHSTKTVRVSSGSLSRSLSENSLPLPRAGRPRSPVPKSSSRQVERSTNVVVVWLRTKKRS